MTIKELKQQIDYIEQGFGNLDVTLRLLVDTNLFEAPSISIMIEGGSGSLKAIIQSGEYVRPQGIDFTIDPQNPVGVVKENGMTMIKFNAPKDEDPFEDKES